MSLCCKSVYTYLLTYLLTYILSILALKEVKESKLLLAKVCTSVYTVYIIIKLLWAKTTFTQNLFLQLK